MTLQIYETIISDGHGELDADYLCIHETANPGATAYDHINYWSRDDKYAVHYVVDWNQRVYHCVPDNRKCWQVGNGNSRVIGIELCHATNQDDFAKVWTVGVEWAAYMLRKHGWGIDRLISHDDARRMWGGTDHTDPIEYFDEYGKTWDEFKSAVHTRMDEGDEDMELTPEQMEQIAAYVWGYERDGVSMANRVESIARDAALEVLGYTNADMNGNADVYQLISDVHRLGLWSYKNERLESVDAYQIIRDTRDGVSELAEEVQELNDKIL